MIDLNRITSNIYFCYFKVEDVTLSYTKMGRDYWKIIAVSIGNQLTRLCLHNWNIENNFIDIQDLQHCHQLKELNIPGLELSEESETKERKIVTLRQSVSCQISRNLGVIDDSHSLGIALLTHFDKIFKIELD